MNTGLESWLTQRWGKWVVPYAALWITMLIGGAVVVVLALLSAEVYDDVVDDAGLANLDKPTLAFMEQLRSPGLDSFVTGFTNIGGGIGMPILGSILTAWLIWTSRTWRPLILIGGAAAVSVTATTLGKTLIGRARPDHADAVPPYEILAVVPQRPHAEHHGGDRARGLPRLPAGPAAPSPGSA